MGTCMVMNVGTLFTNHCTGYSDDYRKPSHHLQADIYIRFDLEFSSEYRT